MSRSAAESHPWARSFWLIQTVWLVFLVFAVLAGLDAPVPTWLKTIGLALTAGFGVTYALGMRRLDRLERCGESRLRVGARSFALLVALALLTMPAMGVGSLTFIPFVVAFGMFALPIVWALAVGVSGFLVAAVVAIFVDPHEGTWVIAVVVFAVGAMTGAIRVMNEKGADYENMSRELAVTAERERVARDVHDVLGHSLTAVTVKAELAERLALAEIRETIGGLRTARLDDELRAARTVLAGAGITAHLPSDPTMVDPRCRTVLAWVLREAITNVVRHSDADECRVELDSTRLRVSDDGRGLDGRPEGNGLRGLRERVEAAGGNLTIVTRPEGYGTAVEVRL